MAIKVDGIQSEDELKKAQAAAQGKGTSVVNYNEWSNIMKELQEGGLNSTGSYAGDKAKLEEVKVAVADYVAQMQSQQKIQQQNVPENKETNKIQEASSTDKNQAIKGNVVNATSSEIMANYMKYYHLLM